MPEPYALWLNAQQGDPEYHAQALRQAFSMFLTHHGTDRFGARAGLHPMGGVTSAANVSGSTWTLLPSVGVVYPAVTAEAGAYVVVMPQTTGTIPPADSANARRDLLFLRVYDDDVDASGGHHAEVGYLTGRPATSPSRPSTPSGTLPILDILVPADGAGSPSGTEIYPMTVASGGITPVRNAADAPSDDFFEGQTIWRLDLGVQMSHYQSRWGPTSHCVFLDQATPTGEVGTGVNLTIPTSLRGMFRRFEIVYQGSLSNAIYPAPIVVRPNNDLSENHRAVQTVQTASGQTVHSNEQASTTLPRFALTGGFSQNNAIIHLMPRTRSTTGFITWHSEGWINNSVDSMFWRAAGRWAGETQEIRFFRVRTSRNDHVWNSGTVIQLYGYL